MTRISQKTEKKLLAAIESTADLINSGYSPNEAIVKVAQDQGVTRSEIPLVVHAYNTGRTNRQRQDSDGIFLKAATFDLADTEAILDVLYPSRVKTASVSHHSSAVSDDYAAPPYDVLREQNRMEKRARFIDWDSVKSKEDDITTLPYDDGRKFLLDMENVRAKKADAEECRRQETVAFDRFCAGLSDLKTYFVSSGSTPYPIVKSAAEFLHGDTGKKLFAMFEQLHPQVPAMFRWTPDVEKRAGVLDCTQAPFPLINDIFNKATAFAAAQAAYREGVATYEKTAKAVKLPLESALSRSIYEETSIMDDEPQAGTEKQADGPIPDPFRMMGAYSMMKNVLSPIAGRIHSNDNEAQIGSLVSRLDDPSHEQKLRLINTHGLLTDLMTNDDVISGYPADDVTDAFSEISQISPSVSDQRGIVQALLRKRLAQGALDPYDQGQLLDFEQKLRQQSVPMSGGRNARS